MLRTSLALLLATSSSLAWADNALTKKYNCTACHAEETKKVGPAYKEVAKRYAADAEAADKLAKKIKAGGMGVWGPIPMPGHPQVPDADLKEMVSYILSLK